MNTWKKKTLSEGTEEKKKKKEAKAVLAAAGFRAFFPISALENWHILFQGNTCTGGLV